MKRSVLYFVAWLGIGCSAIPMRETNQLGPQAEALGMDGRTGGFRGFEIEECLPDYQEDQIVFEDLDLSADIELVMESAQAVDTPPLCPPELNENGLTMEQQAFLYAVRKGSVDTIERLLHEDDLKLDVFRGVPLLYAVRKGLTAVVHVLLRHRDEIHMCRDEPLIEACRQNNPELVHLLLQHGANSNAREGMALLIAIRHNSNLLLELLIAYGADFSQHHELPLRLIAASGRTSLLTPLLSHNYRRQLFEKWGMPVLHLPNANIHVHQDMPIRLALVRGYIMTAHVLARYGSVPTSIGLAVAEDAALSCFLQQIPMHPDFTEMRQAVLDSNVDQVHFLLANRRRFSVEELESLGLAAAGLVHFSATEAIPRHRTLLKALVGELNNNVSNLVMACVRDGLVKSVPAFINVGLQQPRQLLWGLCAAITASDLNMIHALRLIGADLKGTASGGSSNSFFRTTLFPETERVRLPLILAHGLMKEEIVSYFHRWGAIPTESEVTMIQRFHHGV